ncbi:uncharacterized protein TRAVEDRAFT_53473 [Trametes versicolor FP-101664 SS1]|uniref:uncharacterized protein n=1 Tax=Trametes versicolor (strain FP-101664) TaxID=717944 RepID=UPI00046226B2|nr:uncharacterized protein TRAVEDRAFT_53473 [Trametes versicolor FP-101664 SS1]EIW53056.1 hypothetical protein TRAVEDRAFT_53473 [Trametes versicolor FP-101664 SS1]
MSRSPGPVVYNAPAGLQASPYKAHTISNHDPRKHGQDLQPNTTLDRRLQGKSSMGTTILVEFQTFVEELLPPLRARKSKLPKQTVQTAKKDLLDLFYKFTPDKKPINPNEDAIACAVVKIINDMKLPKGYQAALSQFMPDLTDETGSKVDAALYPKGKVPSNGRPDWTHCRLYMEFKVGNTKYDPWDDREGVSAESERKSRAAVRAQLIAYAHHTFRYQHRTKLYSLFIIGDAFRAARWDRSGVIVSRKVNYVVNPELLLQFLWHFAHLDDVQQGMDPTVDLLEPDSHAFRMMDYLARPDPSVDVDYMEPGTHWPTPSVPPSASSATTAPNTSHPPSAVADSTPGTSSDTGGGNGGLPPSTPGDKEGVWARRTRSSSKVAAMPPPIPPPTPPPAEDMNTPPVGKDPDLAVVEEFTGDPRVFKYVREMFRESLKKGWPRYKIRVGKDKRVFLVGRHIFCSSSMFGRATRGYIAVDARTRRFVFLKDSWRPYYEGVEPEGTYLAMFANQHDMVVPTLICHGDVEGQRAFTAIYEGDPQRKIRDNQRRLAAQAKNTSAGKVVRRGSTKKRPHEEEDEAEPSSGDTTAPAPLAENEDRLRHHIHYRTVVQDVCLPFDKFCSTKQFIRLMFDCVQTHQQAYLKFGLLHRDISAGNVLILPRHTVNKKGKEVVRWFGLLTDWELAKIVPKDGEDDKARQPERTGTWQFMSVASVASQWTLPISVADELESFFHVMLFYAVRYLPHTMVNVPKFVIAYFDTFEQDNDGTRLCSATKWNAMRWRMIRYGKGRRLLFKKTTGRSGNPLNRLFARFLTALSARYELLDYANEAHDKLPSPVDSLTEVDEDEEDDDFEINYNKPWYAKEDEDEDEEDDDLAVYAEEPSTATSATASLLNTHDFFLNRFANVLQLGRKRWVNPDALGIDQLAGYESRAIIVAMEEAGTSTAGRARGTRESSGRASSKRAKTGSGSSLGAVRTRGVETDSNLVVSRSRKGKGRA